MNLSVFDLDQSDTICGKTELVYFLIGKHSIVKERDGTEPFGRT